MLLSNCRTAPIEVLECEFPTRIRRWELIPDSGGPGEFRGGLASRRQTEIVGAEAQISMRGTGEPVAAFGRDGGRPGRNAGVMTNPGTPQERALPNKFGGLVLRRGEVLQTEQGGGGGLADPRRRPFDLVVSDVLDGYVTRAAAIADYGVDAQRLDAALAEWEAVASRTESTPG